jgi:hypothetical protein
MGVQWFRSSYLHQNPPTRLVDLKRVWGSRSHQTIDPKARNLLWHVQQKVQMAAGRINAQDRRPRIRSSESDVW